MTTTSSTTTYAIEATYKGETGLLQFRDPKSFLAGIVPTEDLATIYTSRAAADAAAEGVKTLQLDAEPWDALTGIRVIEVTR